LAKPLLAGTTWPEPGGKPQPPPRQRPARPPTYRLAEAVRPGV
jgi:hypothetical protein